MLSWKDKYPNEINIRNLYLDDSWKELFLNLFENKKFIIIEKFINKHKNNITIFPYPDYLWNSFNMTPMHNIKSIIISQDPYIGKHEDIPQAMGIAFSVQESIPFPSSLQNIFKNMIKFGHIDQMPESGDLSYLSNQGCLLINSSLTVFEKQAGSHMKIWEWFTDEIIKYLSDKFENIIFVLWGAFAVGKLKYIDENKHNIIISSHPSGLSCNKALKQYPSFNNNDHFGQINEYLIKNGKSPLKYKK